MKVNDNILSPGIEITSPYIDEKNQRKKNFTRKGSGFRSNDRKNTRSRKTQVIRVVDDSVWPPVMYEKHIKHPAR